MAYIIETRPTHRRRASILDRFARFYSVWHQRQTLKTLNKDALDDIGISYRDASNESRRPFWDAPATWRC